MSSKKKQKGVRLKNAKKGDLILIGRLNTPNRYFSFGYSDGYINCGDVHLAVKANDGQYYIKEGLAQSDMTKTRITELDVIAKKGEF